MNIDDRVIYKGKVYFIKSMCNTEGRNWTYMLAERKDDLYTKWKTVWMDDEKLVLKYDGQIPEFKQLSIFDF
jgi:hypothetical protein